MTSAAIAPSVVSGTTPANSSSSSSTSSSTSTVGGLANNFQTFLTLLTTQLKNQDPLSPLDSNQFTQQLVQFAQVEQQLKSNDQLASLVALQKTAQSTQALNFVGKTAVVNGSTATLSSGLATWSLSAPKDANATITITASNGQTAYSGAFNVTSGSHNFVWDGKGTDGTQWPDGNYTMSITAKDTSGADVAISTEVQGTITSADLTASPPLLSIGGQNYTIDQIKRVVS